MEGVAEHRHSRARRGDFGGAANLLTLDLPTVLPGIKMNTKPTNYHPIRQKQLAKFDGTTLGPLRRRNQGRW
jgi:hypothetical protein